MRRNLLTMWFLLIGFSPVFAQQEWSLKLLGKTQGLSNSAVTSIYKDKNGYVWIGTWDGLNRYDGNQITTYKPKPENEFSLSNNVIKQILEDKHGNLWVVTLNGINRYDRNRDGFKKYLLQSNDEVIIEDNIKAVLTKDSTLLIHKTGWGIGKYQAGKDSFILMDSLNAESIGNIITIGSHGNFSYFLNDNGVVVVTDTLNNIGKIGLNWQDNYKFQKFVEINNSFFLAYQTNDYSVQFIELNGDSVISKNEILLQNKQVSTVNTFIDKDVFFIGTTDGEILEGLFKSNKFQITSLVNKTHTLSQKKLKIFSINRFDNDILWIGTDGDGVYRYLTKERSFNTISGEMLPSDVVRSVFKDSTGKLYVGTRSGGLVILDSVNRKSIILNTDNHLSGNTVLSITPDKEGNIWLGLDSEGIDMIEHSTGKVYHFPRDFVPTVNMPFFGSVYAIVWDSSGNLWLGTSGYGVVNLKIKKNKNGKYRLLDYDFISNKIMGKNNSLINSNVVYAIKEEKPDLLWFGTRNGGLYRYNSISKEITNHITFDEQFNNSLSNNDVLSLLIDKNKRLWVGTSGGLNSIDLNTLEVKQHTNNCVNNNTIHAILEDQFSDLWLTTNNGIFKFSPGDNNCKNFNWNDGLINYEYTDGAYFKPKKENNLYFGGTKGLDIITPSKITVSKSFPKLIITGINISNSRNKENIGNYNPAISINHVENHSELNLEHYQNFIELKFTSLDYWNKQRCNYRYHIKGYNDDWVNLGSSSSINLTNISSGTYEIHLNNSNEEGIWNSEEFVFTILISPPFWATNFAFVVYLLLFFALQLFLIFLFRKRAKKRKAIAFEILKRKQDEATQQYKLDFFTDVAHEFRTPLTLIFGHVVSLLEKTKDNEVFHSTMSKVYKNTLRLQKLIDEIIQFRKIEIGRESLSLKQIDVVYFTGEIIESFQKYASDKNIQLSFKSNHKSILCYLDPAKLEKILINLISNAIKYNIKGGKVILKINQDGNKLLFSIKDTGIGIDENHMKTIFERFNAFQNSNLVKTNSVGIGLSLTKKLIKMHQGDIFVKSIVNKGSVFKFWLPTDIKIDGEEYFKSNYLFNKEALYEQVDVFFDDYKSKSQKIQDNKITTHNHTVLIVDDNTNILLLLKDLLNEKYNIVSCTNTTDAYKVLKVKNISIVVSDVVMPDGDGYTFCQKLKADIDTSHIPVILLTAKGDIEERIQGLEMGADAYIPKPFHPKHLHIRIEKLIESRDLLKDKFALYSRLKKDSPTLGIGRRDDEFFKKLHDCIIEKISDSTLDAQLLADNLNMSKTSLYKKIKTLTNKTPHSIINEYRLKKATLLLIETDTNISEIIDVVGYNSRSYFYKIFNETFGCSPVEYRNMNKKSHYS